MVLIEQWCSRGQRGSQGEGERKIEVKKTRRRSERKRKGRWEREELREEKKGDGKEE